MPPRTRTRATKILKENIEVLDKSKVVANGKVTKKPRKPLGDKTNSLSDDNESIDIPIKTSAKVAEITAKKVDKRVRPRRDRRLPARFVENDVLLNSSKSKDGEIPIPQTLTKRASMSSSVEVITDKNTATLQDKGQERPKRNCRLRSAKEKPITESNTPNKMKTTVSPFKTPTINLNSTLVANKPKRICRLPSKLEDHTISPNKFIPVPSYASTPIMQKKTDSKDTNEKYITKEISTHTITQKQKTNTKINKKSPDTNNNAKSKTTKKPNISTKLGTKQTSSAANKKSPITKQIINNNSKIINKITPTISQKSKYKSSPEKSPRKRLINTNFSLRILEQKPQKHTEDVYEFTFDPNEEPAPLKKKRKRIVKKKPPKPKTVILKSNYDQNVSKALETLKSKVKPVTQPIEKTNEKTADKVKEVTEVTKNSQLKPIEINNVSYAPPLTPINESAKTSIHESNYVSIRVEDIAADFEPVPENHVDLNYSPVNSPAPPETPENQNNIVNNTATLNKDPLNLQGDISFFDEVPVASSSMNVSVRHPLASPWRVEFGSLPIKWQQNTYVKPNMTPAVESSFIALEDQNKKKHVYALVPQITNESLPPIETTPNLIQTSIISHFREVAERSANKKKRGRSVTPTKANTLFEDCSNTEFGYKTPKKARKDKVVATPNTSNNSNKSVNKDTSKESNQSQKQTNKDKNCTYFGFDETAEEDCENVSPVKKQSDRLKGLRPRARAVLKEINNQGPTRSILPVVAKKLASSEVVDKMYDQLKSAEDAPQFPDKQTAPGVTGDAATNIDDLANEDDESVHLFEDIELIHHLKPLCKSYSKPKKVAFQENSFSDSDDTQQEVPARVTDDEYDDLADLTYHMPDVTKKKPKKKTKKQLTKKEEKEVEEWAAGFNSMCEDIDEFPLIVE